MLLTALLLSFQAGPKEELLHLAERLEKLQHVSFEYRRLLDYGSNDFKHELTAKVYVEFEAKWKPLGFRFRATSAAADEAYDGSAYWIRSKGKDKKVVPAPPADYFTSLSTMKNSLFGLAASLRAVAKTEGLSIEFDKNASRFKFEWKGKELAVSRPSSVEYWPVYEITVDPKLGLPSKIVQRLKDKRDTIITEFKSYDLNPPAIKWD